MADLEPQPTGENSPYPPFLTENQLDQLGHSFSYDNFNVVSPPDKEPFMVVTVPESAQPFVDQALQRAKEEAFKQMKEVGKGMQDAEEQERGAWSEVYLPILHGVGRSATILR